MHLISSVKICPVPLRYSEQRLVFKTETDTALLYLFNLTDVVTREVRAANIQQPGGAVPVNAQETQLWAGVCVCVCFFLNRLIQSGGNLTSPEQKMESGDSDTERSVLGGEECPMRLL